MRRLPWESSRPQPACSPAPPIVRQPAVRLDAGGIGDTLCALAAATGASLPFIPPANRGEWVELFADVPEIEHPSIDLRLNDYRPIVDQNVAPRWEFWSAQTGGRKLPELRPLPPSILDQAIPYAGRVVIAPFAVHGPAKGEWNRCWPVSRWMEVNRLLVNAGFSTVILDARDEDCWQFLSDDAVPNSPGDSYRIRTALLCGKSPALVAAVLRWSSAFAGNDSGMAHLAGTLGAPGVGVCSACSDVRILGGYPSITSLGGRGRDFLQITPEQVTGAILDRARSALTFPHEQFAATVPPWHQWRVSAWLCVYEPLWNVARRLGPSRVIEIGTRAGMSAWTFLNACPAATLIGIDANLHGHDWEDGSNEHARSILPADRFELRLADSHTLTELPAADLVYVDGDHTEAGCFQDLELALTARPRWILVDDVANCAASVKPACDRFVRERGLVCEFIPSPTGLYLIHLG